MPNLFGPFLVGVLVALLAGALLLPILRRLKAGQSISGDAPKRHQTKAGTPTMGGAIILVGGLVPALIYPRPSGNGALLAAVVLCTAAFGLIGFLDDFLIVKRGKNLGLRAREKLAGQIVVALLFAGWYWWTDPSGFYAGQPVLDPLRIGLALWHAFLLVGMSNAVNLTDGLDGLAAGVSLPVWVALALMAGLGGYVAQPLGGGVGDHGLVVLCAAFAGATLGYLWYNAHPAQVFMGDTGSLAIGGGLTAAAIALRLEWVLLIAALVHVIEAVSVILQVISFKLTGRRIFKMSPLHHHYELCEQPETRIVARFAIASTVCAGVALALFFRG
jgi:phospho-N-acetylmuramoyl-pentapeptide-transferase